ncbi:MAG: hypothetical protein H6671_06370 [Anaerolineaceae bacterium]|nr:hypothetical protein [Anaerolineaceae bacterium]
MTNDLLRFNVQATHTQYTWNLSTGDYTTDAIQTTPVPYSSVLSDLAYSLIPYTQSARRQVTSTAQMPDSSILAFTDGISVQFWDMDTRLPLGQIRFFGIVKGFNDDHTVMVTHSNGVIWLWTISP